MWFCMTAEKIDYFGTNTGYELDKTGDHRLLVAGISTTGNQLRSVNEL